MLWKLHGLGLHLLCQLDCQKWKITDVLVIRIILVLVLVSFFLNHFSYYSVIVMKIFLVIVTVLVN